MTVFEETDTYLTPIVGERETPTVGGSVESPPHAP